MNGSIKAHSASVRSLAHQNPRQKNRCRAISVKAIVSLFISANELDHNPLKSLKYPLRFGSERGETGRVDDWQHWETLVLNFGAALGRIIFFRRMHRTRYPLEMGRKLALCEVAEQTTAYLAELEAPLSPKA